VATDTNVSSLATTFDVGDQARLTVDVKVDDVLTDPTGLQIQVKDPDRVVVSFAFPGDSEVVNDAVGQFHFDFSVLSTGRHVYKWIATGAAVGAEERSFIVKESEFD